MNRKKILSFIILLFALGFLPGAGNSVYGELSLFLDFTSGESQLLEVGATHDTSIDLSANVNKASTFTLVDKKSETDTADFIFDGSVNIYWKINTGITPIKITIAADPFKNEKSVALPWTISLDGEIAVNNSRESLSKEKIVEKYIDVGYVPMSVAVDASSEADSNFVNMPSVPETTFTLTIGVDL